MVKINNNLSYNKQKNKTLLLCWIAYASIYFGRVNLAIAVPLIQDQFLFDKVSVGLIGTMFFWIYAIGQLVNGLVGDRVSGKWMVFWGLIVAGIANILFGFATSIIVMIIIWSINGYFQSMLWGPIMKILSRWFPKNSSNIVAIKISTSMVLGYLMAWSFSGKVSSILNWQWVFFIPGIFLIIFAVIWFFNIRVKPKGIYGVPEELSLEPKEGDNKGNNKVIKFADIFFKKKLWVIVLACLTQGIIKEGISLWGPTFLMESQGATIVQVASLIAIIPISNFFGMIVAGWINAKFNYDEKRTVAVLYAFSVVFLVGLFFVDGKGLLLGIGILSLLSATMFGANTMLLGVVPLKFAKYNKTSTIAGFLDFCTYIAAGVSAVMTGFIVDKLGWSYVIIFWVIIALMGIAVLSIHINKKPTVKE